jgi:hypothetical protein
VATRRSVPLNTRNVSSRVASRKANATAVLRTAALRNSPSPRRRDVRRESVVGTKAEVRQRLWFCRFKPGQHRRRGGLSCTTGRLRMCVMRKLPVVPLCRSRALLLETPNQYHLSRYPASPRGAYRDRHGRWVRDAVDASAVR